MARLASELFITPAKRFTFMWPILYWKNRKVVCHLQWSTLRCTNQSFHEKRANECRNVNGLTPVAKLIAKSCLHPDINNRYKDLYLNIRDKRAFRYMHVDTKTRSPERVVTSRKSSLISDDGMVYIPAGLSRYSFRIQIPHNIPCSFEHTYGYIRYTIKGIIDRPWKFDHECKAAFTVISIYDLNLRRERCVSRMGVWMKLRFSLPFPFSFASFDASRFNRKSANLMFYSDLRDKVPRRFHRIISPDILNRCYITFEIIRRDIQEFIILL